jgi:hypothetical protein
MNLPVRLGKRDVAIAGTPSAEAAGSGASHQGAHCRFSLRWLCAQSCKYKLMMLWQGTPISAAMPLKYAITSGDECTA